MEHESYRPGFVEKLASSHSRISKKRAIEPNENQSKAKKTMKIKEENVEDLPLKDDSRFFDMDKSI